LRVNKISHCIGQLLLAVAEQLMLWEEMGKFEPGLRLPSNLNTYPGLHKLRVRFFTMIFHYSPSFEQDF
jgi:hypothetical protein